MAGNGDGGGRFFFRAPFSSAHLIRPASSPHPSNGSPFHSVRRASKQGKTAGGHRRFSAPSSYPRPVSSSPRLAPRVAWAGRKASRSYRPRLIRPTMGRHFFSVETRAGQGMSSARLRSHHGKQAGKGGPSPVPPIVSVPWLVLGSAVNGRNGK